MERKLFERDYKRDMYRGFGDGLARAFEFALTPAIFGGMGYLLDRWLGLLPVLTIVFVVFSLCGMFVRLWYGYDREMRQHEAEGAWARPDGANAQPTERAA